MDFQNEGPHYFYQEVIISSEDLKKKKKENLWITFFSKPVVEVASFHG